MMAPVRQMLYELFGRHFGVNELVAIFSVRLDEAGTDGRSPYTAVAGAVASIQQWESLEKAWERLLARRQVRAFHFKEFQQRSGDFKGWSNLKSNTFSAAMEKIIKKHTLFRIAVGIEDAVHTEIKERMKGIKGFGPDSNYGLCLRYLMFLGCEYVSKQVSRDAKVTLMIEDGPWASGAVKAFSQVSGAAGRKWTRVKHAHMLDGISVIPKGKTRTLEAADYLVGTTHQRMLIRKFTRRHHPQVSILLDRPFLEQWYEKMIEEKERRRARRKI